MLAKTGFIIAVLCFGIFMFIAGIYAPSDVQAPVKKITGTLVSHIPFEKLGFIQTTSSDSSKENNDLPPVEYTTLTVPDIIPEGAQYALEIIRDVSDDIVNSKIEALQQHSYAVHKILIKGPGKNTWTVLGAGTYSTPEEARLDRLNLREDLNITDTNKTKLDVIMLPPPPKEATS